MKLQAMIRRMVARVLGVGIAAGACILATAPAEAVTIFAAGSNVDLGSGWRTSTVVKNDIDGNNVLGSDGYRIVGSNARVLKPTYLSAVTQSANIFGGNAGYATIDDPNTTPGGAPTLIGSGTTNPFAGVNNEASVFTFTVGTGAPETFRLAVMVDNTDGTQFTSNGLRLLQTVGGTANSGLVNTSTVNRVTDWYYFDVVGAQVGDTFSVQSAGGPSGCNCVGGIAFDSLGGPTTKTLWSVDIQGTGGTPMTGLEPVYNQGKVWNIFNIQHHPSAVVNPTMNLVSSDGAASTATFSILGTVSAFNGGGPLTTDYLFIGAGNVSGVHSINWEITGLEAGGIYEMFVYGNTADTSGTGRNFLMTIDLDGDGLLDEAGLNVTQIGTLFSSIIADENGRIFGNVFRASGEANWSGFQIRQIGQIVIPEPATMSLLVLAGAAMLRRRRLA